MPLTSLAQKIARSATLLAIGCALGACGSPPSDPAPAATESNALACQSGGMHVEGCPIVNPPPPPPPTCTTIASCSGTTKTTPGFDPLWVPAPTPAGGSGDYWQVDTSFSDLLGSYGCAPEVSFFEGGGWFFATSICPSTIFPAINQVGATYSRAVVSEIECNTCTGTPGKGKIVVAWLTAVGAQTVCGTGPHGNPICSLPGGGCQSVSCMVF